jgi:hypothetical protein
MFLGLAVSALILFTVLKRSTASVLPQIMDVHKFQ